ncbi:hypothetical protein VitviT2T_009879 [Vitis vinifera]|uniref:START domain-containing protein n=2 Tax=Vitis vinifera TaxID=29760 RepID=A0ABY9C6S9_VITVI|nr:homeobox-leucine zipper protein ROC7-like isoform X1 [Vitis vinifera]XP_019076451.1 homeobox-leucine zipper protein ROC7-like isoform X1 [Vitis vinifera]WJZ90754.1 hypothetical protein VitviT2T_009879 [Vitis vinifera]|eukprot:XP_010652409.1 PREDICTED: homeobox-leucine zipper protein ROC7-like isoform X1 [Vitis vinifera]
MDKGKSKVIEREADKCENPPPRKEKGYGSSSRQSEVTANRTEQPVKTLMREVDDCEDDEMFYPELQEANNIFKAVYKEIMTIAFEANYYVEAVPALGSIEELQKVFRISPPSDWRLETTTETAIVPISARSLCMNMMNLDSWHASMSHIFHYVGGYIPDGVFKHLKDEDPSILHVEMVNAEFQLPTPFAAVRKFSFLRFLKEIIPDELWAIIDVSKDYFQHIDMDYMFEGKCRRRPSGVIIRARDDHSEIIWIENVEVPVLSQFQDNIYSAIINSDVAFSAKRWVDAFLWNLKRYQSAFFIQEIKWGRPYYLFLLSLTKNMRLDFMKCLRESPDDRDWTLLTDHGMRIMQDATMRSPEACKICGYISVVSFRIQAKPHLVFQYLVKKNRQLQWHLFLDEKEVLRFAADDESYLITLHQRSIITENSCGSEEYILQEASWDGFGYLIISAIMNQADVFCSLVAGYKDVDLKPSGFAIVPDGFDSSLVTFSLQEVLQVPDTHTGIRVKSCVAKRIISEIIEEMADVVKSAS